MGFSLVYAMKKLTVFDLRGEFLRFSCQLCNSIGMLSVEICLYSKVFFPIRSEFAFVKNLN